MDPQDPADGKRKASDEPTSPSAAKRAKHQEDAEPDAVPDTKPVMPKRIPFPEKVPRHFNPLQAFLAVLTLLAALAGRHRGARRRD